MVALCSAPFSLGFLTAQVYFPESLKSTARRTMERLYSRLSRWRVTSGSWARGLQCLHTGFTFLLRTSPAYSCSRGKAGRR